MVVWENFRGGGYMKKTVNGSGVRDTGKRFPFHHLRRHWTMKMVKYISENSDERKLRRWRR